MGCGSLTICVDNSAWKIMVNRLQFIQLCRI